MKKLLLSVTVASLMFSCGGGEEATKSIKIDACYCIEKSAELAQKMVEEGADIEALSKESAKLNEDCDAAANKDVEAWAESIKSCK